MNAVQYIILNKGADMSTGKAAAQAGHAAVEGFRLSSPDMIHEWYLGGHHTKIVLEVPNAFALFITEGYLFERGIKNKLIVDEGRTEVSPMTPTAIGTEIVDKDDPHIKAAFSSFKLYKDPPAVLPAEPRRRRWPWRKDSAIR